MFDEESVVLADYGFRCAEAVLPNVKWCMKETWNERMTIDTHFSLLKMHIHRISRWVSLVFGP